MKESMSEWVLLPIDGSACSAGVIDEVINRKWSKDTHFLVLNVVPLRTSDRLDAVAREMDPSLEPALIRQAERLVLDTVDYIRPQLGEGLEVDGRVVEGHIFDQIVHVAASWGASSIIIGTHGRTGLRKFFLGSVAEAVLQHAPCTVEVIRSDKAPRRNVDTQSNMNS